MFDINHRVGIKAPSSKIFQAVSTIEGISGWWTTSTTGITNSDRNLKVTFLSLEGKEIGSMDFEITILDPNKKIQWRFTAGPEEWIGTDVIFSLTEEGEYTIVLFSHKNWREAIEFMAHCSMKWAIFMMSLKEFLESGKGKPSPLDIKIDNWN